MSFDTVERISRTEIHKHINKIHKRRLTIFFVQSHCYCGKKKKKKNKRKRNEEKSKSGMISNDFINCSMQNVDFTK